MPISAPVRPTGPQNRGLDFHSIGGERGFWDLMSPIARWPFLGRVAATGSRRVHLHISLFHRPLQQPESGRKTRRSPGTAVVCRVGPGLPCCPAPKAVRSFSKQQSHRHRLVPWRLAAFTDALPASIKYIALEPQRVDEVDRIIQHIGVPVEGLGFVMSPAASYRSRRFDSSSYQCPRSAQVPLSGELSSYPIPNREPSIHD